MEFRQKRLSIEGAKEIDMVNYLSGLGYGPASARGNDFWYRSPLREETTPSFKVNRGLNKWYGHGIGKGGNLVDFGVAFSQCTVAESLARLAGNFSLQQPPINVPKIDYEPEHKVIIKGDFILASYYLLRCLKQRRIPIEIAEKYGREVCYEFSGKTYYGTGFKNDSGGYEIRNPHLKISSSPKGMATFQNGSDEVTVFEGFMDFYPLRHSTNTFLQTVRILWF